MKKNDQYCSLSHHFVFKNVKELTFSQIAFMTVITMCKKFENNQCLNEQVTNNQTCKTLRGTPCILNMYSDFISLIRLVFF